MSRKKAEAEVTSDAVAETPKADQLTQVTEALGGLVAMLTELAKRQSPGLEKAPVKIKTYRGSAAKFLMSFEAIVTSLNATEILSYQQSESDGNITGTIIYR